MTPLLDQCRFPECTEPVAAAGMSRCTEHRMRWSPGKPVDPPARRLPEWRRHLTAKDMSGWVKA